MWTLEDIEFLVKYYPNYGCAYVATHLNKTKSSVYSKAQKLKLKSLDKKQKTHAQYSEELKGKNLEVLETYQKDGIALSHKCNICEHTWKASPSHILQGRGCPRCGGSLKKTTEQYVTELCERSINILEPYLGNKVPIKHQCTKCDNVWKAAPGDVLHKISGCPSCASSGFDRNKPAIMYYIKIGNYYKIGITNRTVSKRFSLDKDKNILIIKEWYFDIGQDAWNQEQLLFKNFESERLHVPGYLKSGGNSELFQFDILGLDKVIATTQTYSH